MAITPKTYASQNTPFFANGTANAMTVNVMKTAATAM